MTEAKIFQPVTLPGSRIYIYISTVYIFIFISISICLKYSGSRIPWAFTERHHAIMRVLAKDCVVLQAVWDGECHPLRNDNIWSELWASTTFLLQSPVVLSNWPLTPTSVLPPSHPPLPLWSSRHIRLQDLLRTSGTDWIIWGRQEKAVYCSGPRQERIHRGGGAQVRSQGMILWIEQSFCSDTWTVSGWLMVPCALQTLPPEFLLWREGTDRGWDQGSDGCRR